MLGILLKEMQLTSGSTIEISEAVRCVSKICVEGSACRLIVATCEIALLRLIHITLFDLFPTVSREHKWSWRTTIMDW